MRVSKLGVWRFDDSRGLYINPAMEQARRIEQARMHEAEARAVEKERLAAELRAEAERKAAEDRAKAEAEKEAQRADDAKPAGEEWYQPIPEEDRPAVLCYLIRRRQLRPGQTLADIPIGRVRKIDYNDPSMVDALVSLGRFHFEMEAEVRRYAEALLCAD
jgi:hypothetical protein